MPSAKKKKGRAVPRGTKTRSTPSAEARRLLGPGAYGVLGPGMMTEKLRRESNAWADKFYDDLDAEGFEVLTPESEMPPDDPDEDDEEDDKADDDDPWGNGAGAPPAAPTKSKTKKGASKVSARPKNPRPSTQVVADDDEKTPEKFAGKWRIVETEVWGEDALDLVVPAYIRFDADDRMGYFQMIAISGSIDCRFDGDKVEFTWLGDDDGEPTGGRGWATITKRGTLEGRIYIHQGDDSAFVAKRVGKPKR